MGRRIDWDDGFITLGFILLLGEESVLMMLVPVVRSLLNGDTSVGTLILLRKVNHSSYPTNLALVYSVLDVYGYMLGYQVQSLGILCPTILLVSHCFK